MRSLIAVEVVDRRARRRPRCATASRCRTPFVEPPLVATAAIAFSSDVLGDDVARAQAALEHVDDELAGLDGDLGLGAVLGRHHRRAHGRMPSTSKAIAIVLAVNWPPQAPAPGLGGLLELVQLLVGHLAGGVRADGLEDVLDRDVAGPGSGRGGSSRRRASRRGRSRRASAMTVPGIVLSQPLMRDDARRRGGRGRRARSSRR